MARVLLGLYDQPIDPAHSTNYDISKVGGYPVGLNLCLLHALLVLCAFIVLNSLYHYFTIYVK